MVGHRLMGMAALHTGDIAGSRPHFDRAIALYDAAEHRALAPRFGQDILVAALSFRAITLWLLGYPELALTDTVHSLKDAHEIDHGPTLMYALVVAARLNIHWGDYAAAAKLADENRYLREPKGRRVLEGVGDALPKHRGRVNGQSLKRNSENQLRNRRLPINRINFVSA